MNNHLHYASKSRDVIDDSPERLTSRRESNNVKKEDKAEAPKVYAFQSTAKTLSRCSLGSSVSAEVLSMRKATSKNASNLQLQKQPSEDYHKIRKAFPAPMPSFQKPKSQNSENITTTKKLSMPILGTISQRNNLMKKDNKELLHNPQRIGISAKITQPQLLGRSLSNAHHAQNDSENILSKSMKVDVLKECSQLPSAASSSAESSNSSNDRQFSLPNDYSKCSDATHADSIRISSGIVDISGEVADAKNDVCKNSDRSVRALGNSNEKSAEHSTKHHVIESTDQKSSEPSAELFSKNVPVKKYPQTSLSALLRRHEPANHSKERSFSSVPDEVQRAISVQGILMLSI